MAAPAFEPCIVHPVVSRYTNWDILGLTRAIFIKFRNCDNTNIPHKRLNFGCGISVTKETLLGIDRRMGPASFHSPTRVSLQYMRHLFVKKHPRTHHAPSHPQWTQPPTMPTATGWAGYCSVGLRCVGCELRVPWLCLFFLWFLDIVVSCSFFLVIYGYCSVGLGCVACDFLWLLPVTGSAGYCSVGYQSQLSYLFFLIPCSPVIIFRLEF